MGGGGEVCNFFKPQGRDVFFLFKFRVECHSPKPQRRGECNYQNNNNNNFLIKKYIQLLKGLKSDLKLVTILKIIRKSSEKILKLQN